MKRTIQILILSLILPTSAHANEFFKMIDEMLGVEVAEAASDIRDIASIFAREEWNPPEPAATIRHYQYENADDFNIQMYSSTKEELPVIDLRLADNGGGEPMPFASIEKPISTWLTTVERTGGKTFVCYAAEDAGTKESLWGLFRMVLKGVKFIANSIRNVRTYAPARHYNVVLNLDTTREGGRQSAMVSRIAFVHRDDPATNELYLQMNDSGLCDQIRSIDLED